MPGPEHFADSPESVGIDPQKLDELFDRAEKEVREGLLPSCQIAVGRRGRLAGMRTFGTVRHEGREAVATDETLYVVFSCSKALVSASAWLLIQEGKLDPGARVADLVPEFAANGKDGILVEQLFVHTAGFPHAPYPPREWHDRDKRLERFARWRLNWEPGSRFEYHSTSSMWVIAELIERISGLGYREFLRTRIAEPLGLPELRLGLPRELHGRLADIEHVSDPLTPEELRELGFPEAPVNEVTEEAIVRFNDAPTREAGVPGGGGVMTAGDLALFYQGVVADLSGSGGPGIWKPELLIDALRIRSGDFLDPVFRRRANRALGVVIAGGEERAWIGFGKTGSESMFGHGGAGGQIGWADPESGISLGYCTNGFDRNPLRQARRGVGLSSRAAVLALAD